MCLKTHRKRLDKTNIRGPEQNEAPRGAFAVGWLRLNPRGVIDEALFPCFCFISPGDYEIFISLSLGTWMGKRVDCHKRTENGTVLADRISPSPYLFM